MKIETDALGRITRVSSPVADYQYGYDPVGNRTFMQRAHLSGAPADVYQYDALSQLTQVWYEADATDPAVITSYDRLQAYTLDPLGNRLEVQENGTDTTYVPNNGQHLTNPMHRYEQVDGATLDYDLTGNLLTDGTNTYTYDIFNRQISMTNLNSTAEYVYDALGRRVAKIVDGVTTYYVYNADYQVIEERDAADQLLARYTYGAGIDEVLTMERDGNTYTYHRDALGSITEITDASGSLVERYEYDVYGTTTIFDSTDTLLTTSAIGNPYLFTGRRYDPESGNYYFRARIYSPLLGRFLQTDPLGYVDGLNLYAYVGNRATTLVDPLGRERMTLYVTWIPDEARELAGADQEVLLKYQEMYEIVLDYDRGCENGEAYIDLKKFKTNRLRGSDVGGGGALGVSLNYGFELDWADKGVAGGAGSACPSGEGYKYTRTLILHVVQYKSIEYDPTIYVLNIEGNLGHELGRKIVKTDKVKLMQICCSSSTRTPTSQQACDPEQHCDMRDQGGGVYHYYDPNNKRGPGLIVDTNDSTYTLYDKTCPYVPNPAYPPHGLCVTCAETGMLTTPRDGCSQ